MTGIKRQRLLILDDDEAARGQLRWAFRDYEVLEACERTRAVQIVRASRPGVAIIDLGLPPRPLDCTEGLRAVEEFLRIDPGIKTLVVSGISVTRANAKKALEIGAFDFFTKPVNLDEIGVMVRRAFYLYGIEKDHVRQNSARADGRRRMLGTSEPMQEVFSVIRKVAGVNMPVLILGESGTGKELAANAIHDLSKRKNGPFVVINCGAIPGELLESELFGHERGAFTGAESRRKGRVEYARGGTLFLDEIGELSPWVQVKLLRFLQEKTIERIGGHEQIEIDARVISATNRKIREMVKTGSFREDLYFRLGAVTLDLPPLRDRGNDIYSLALAFLRKYAREFGTNPGFDRNAVAALLSYPWPGNVRELENKIKSAVALCNGEVITPQDLALPSPSPGAEKPCRTTNLAEANEEFKKRMIQETLLENNGVITRSAHSLGITRQYLSKLILKYNIKTG